MATLKTVRSWEKSLRCKIEILEISGGKVTRIKCPVCAKYKERIKNKKGYSKEWAEGTGSVKKDSLEKHLKGDPHCTAVVLERKDSMGGSQYTEEVVSNTPIGKGLARMQEKDRKVCMIIS